MPYSRSEEMSLAAELQKAFAVGGRLGALALCKIHIKPRDRLGRPCSSNIDQCLLNSRSVACAVVQGSVAGIIDVLPFSVADSSSV